MDKKIIALIDAIISDKIDEEVSKIEISTPKRGPKGLKGLPGRDFSFEENKEQISSIIDNFINESRSILKLNFSDLTEDEKESIRGPRGQKGEPGKSFIFDDHEEKIKDQINELISKTKDDLKLRFSDLSQDEIDKLRGPRGPRGVKGKGFSIDEHISTIEDILKQIITDQRDELKLKFSDLSFEEKDLLKIKFSDLSEEEKLSLKGDQGSRGPRGQKGSRGISAYQVWLNDGNVGDVRDFISSLIGEKGQKGNIGPMGPQGKPGISGVQGRPGINGIDAPSIIDIEIKEIGDSIYFIFYFSDGSTIETNEIDLPGFSGVINNYYHTSTTSNTRATKLTIDKIASEEIIIGQVTRFDSSTTAALAKIDTYENAKAAGIALNSAGIGQIVTILILGIREDGSYAFTLNQPLYLQADSYFGETPPNTSGQFIVRIGESLGTGAIFVRVEEPEEIL